MNRMLGFLPAAPELGAGESCAKILLAQSIAIKAIATASTDVNGDFAGFIESNFEA